MDMCIENKSIRSGVAIFSGIFIGILDVFSDFIMFKIKGAIKSHVKALGPKDPFLIHRLLVHAPEDVLKDRAPVRINDLNVEKNTWIKGRYYIEAHNASHFHHDFSIIVNGQVYRMARTPSKGNIKSGFLGLFPGPKEKSGWVIQPEHYVDEVPNPKLIAKGYGAGTTEVIATGDCYVKVSDDGHMSLMFDNIDGVYSLIEKDDMVLMIRKQSYGGYYGKHNMKSVRLPDQFYDDNRYAFFEKKDGAAVEWHVVKASNGKKYLQVYSWRQDAMLNKRYGVDSQINHTYKLHLADKPLSDDFPIVSGRGELWLKGESGLLKINSILNSHNYRARSLKHRPYLYVHDVVSYEGKSVEHLSYKEKLIIMKSLHDSDNRFKIPPHASTSTGKRNLWLKAKSEDGIDGVVVWDMDSRRDSNNGTPIKIKFKHDHDNWFPATIVDVKNQEGKHSDTYSYPVLENAKGTRFVSSGKGLTNEMKADMNNKPDNYIGMEVRYSTEKHFEETGKPWQPTIEEFKTV